MSIVVSVKIYDGVVLGADSQAQIYGAGPDGALGMVQTYGNARKLFQLGDLPIGVGTWGIANIGKRSVESLLLEFSEGIPCGEECSVQTSAKQLLDFLRSYYLAEFQPKPGVQPPVLGVLVAGYTKGVPTAEEWDFRIAEHEEPRSVRPADQFGASWRGVTLPFTRLFRGLDPRLFTRLHELGVSDEILSQVRGGIKMPIIFDTMPLQDAVDFARFILEVTVNAARFETGPASCGGALDLAVIKPDVGFKWIKRKPLEIITYAE